MKHQYVNESEAADHIGMSRFFLRALRIGKKKDRGPPYIKVGSRSIRYSIEKLQAWMDERTIEPEKTGDKK